ncbi:MAG: D-alanyl-D-alanine carboxypeptidase, partial [Planctomycetota bacterium]
MGGCWFVRTILIVLWAGAASAVAQRMEARIAAFVAEAEGLGVRTGVAAVEIDGTSRYHHRADDRFVPASNMKLLSAAAVLHGLGRSYEFRTRFELQGGRLVVHAGGDPNLITGTEHAPETMWRGLVAALIRRGVRSVRAVELDQGVFRGPSRPPTWPQDQLDTYYCAPTGGFVLEQGTFRLQLRPEGATAAAVLVAPFLDMPVDGSIAVVAAKKGAVYGAMDLGDRLKVQGKMWKGSNEVVIQTAVRDPLPWFERGVLQALREGGIRVTADSPAVDEPL